MILRDGRALSSYHLGLGLQAHRQKPVEDLKMGQKLIVCDVYVVAANVKIVVDAGRADTAAATVALTSVARL